MGEGRFYRPGHSGNRNSVDPGTIERKAKTGALRLARDPRFKGRIQREATFPISLLLLKTITTGLRLSDSHIRALGRDTAEPTAKDSESLVLYTHLAGYMSCLAESYAPTLIFPKIVYPCHWMARDATETSVGFYKQP